jgi:hypothetical protein
VTITDETRSPSATADHAHPPIPLVSLKHGVVFCVAVFLSMRVLLSLAGVVGVRATEPSSSAMPPGAPPSSYVMPATPGFHNAWDGMQRWDSPWYLWISHTGWGSGATIAYSPGYPFAISILDSVLPGHELPAALLISNLAFLGALIVLFSLTTMERSKARAPWAILLLCAYPASFFFFAPYSDAPFLLASLLALRWARSGRWELAALAGIAACLFRNVGVALVPALLVEARTQQSERSRASQTAYAASVALGPTVPLIVSASLGHGLFEPLNAQRYWGRVATFPLVTIGRGLAFAIDAIVGRGGIFYLVDAIPVALVLLLAVLGFRKLPLPYLSYVWVSLLLPLSFPQPGHPFVSVARYAAVLFPLVWVAGDLLERRSTLILVAGMSLAFEVALAVWFMNWGAVV